MIFAFAFVGWINKFGVDYTRLKWQVWDVNKWNKLITRYSLLNSPFKLTITGGLFPTYRQKISSNLDWELDANNFNKISDLNISSTGLKLKNKIVFPFYNLEGDDYIVEDFINEIKIFVNEGSLGIFLKDTYDSILISRNLINKVHNFVNGRKMAEKELTLK